MLDREQARAAGSTSRRSIARLVPQPGHNTSREPLHTSCVIVEAAREFAKDMQPVGTDLGTIDESLSRFGCARDYRDNFLAHDSPNASSQHLQPGQTGRPRTGRRSFCGLRLRFLIVERRNVTRPWTSDVTSRGTTAGHPRG
jgi:hypothetical protein